MNLRISCSLVHTNHYSEVASKKKKGFKSNQTSVQPGTLKETGKGERKPLPGNTAWNSFPTSSSPGSWKINLVIFLLLVTVTGLLYSGDLQLGFFVVDDPGYVTDNPWIKNFSLGHLLHILSVPYYSNFSPTHLLSYLVDFALAGPDPYWFHLSGNIWAGIVAGFVFLVAHELVRDRFMAVAAALLFVLHPVHVESVAWISSRKDLIAAAFILPCFLAYVRYRQNISSARWWYILSLFLFLFAIGGKLSVAVFPAVLLALDLFVEKRPFVRAVPDKLPFLIISIIFAWMVSGAQPPSGNSPDPFVYLASLGESLWLLTGFGSYTLFRAPAHKASLVFEILAVLLLFAVFVLPLMLRRFAKGKIALLIYWVLFTYLPSQVLTFIHPVADRYLFLPSVAVVILLAWGVISAGRIYGGTGRMVSAAILLFIGVMWGLTTIRYLKEWQDPRTVLFNSVKKTEDPDVYYSLGVQYLNLSARLGKAPRGEPLSSDKKENLASYVWKEDSRLPRLISEWRGGDTLRLLEEEFKKHLWNLSEEAFNHALQIKGERAMPHVFFRRGVLHADRGENELAKNDFLATLVELEQYTVMDEVQQLTVMAYSNLGVMEAKLGNLQEALHWYRLGEEAQNRFGGNWVPDIAKFRMEVEENPGGMPVSRGKIENENDPVMAFNTGMYFVNRADSLGTAPIPDLKRLAKEVWKNHPGLSSLLAKWDSGQRGSPEERAFREHLKNLAWDSFEQSLKLKGSRLMPELFFRRGMMMAQRGDLQQSRKEFLATLNEAAQDTASSVRKDLIVVCLDALGVTAWKSKDYKGALHWFQKALQQQNSFGGNWVPDLEKKCKQMKLLMGVSG